MPLPQDIRPVFQDIQDTLVRAEARWIETSPTANWEVVEQMRDRAEPPRAEAAE